jgi:hypothetical protein
MANISTMVNARWFLGIPWFNPKPFDLSIIGAAESILGDLVIGYQAANEPDLYGAHGHRNDSLYGPFDYFGEFSDLITQLGQSGLDPTGRAATKMLGMSSLPTETPLTRHRPLHSGLEPQMVARGHMEHGLH